MYMAASIVYNVRRAPWTRYIGLAAVGTSSNNVPYSRPASTIDRAATGAYCSCRSCRRKRRVYTPHESLVKYITRSRRSIGRVATEPGHAILLL